MNKASKTRAVIVPDFKTYSPKSKNKILREKERVQATEFKATSQHNRDRDPETILQVHRQLIL